MTQDQILSKIIDEYYKNVPHSEKNDFAKHILNPQRECALKAMDQWAKYYNYQMPVHIGTLEFDKGQGTYLSCDGSRFNELYMLQTEEFTIFAVAPQHTRWDVGDVFYTAKKMPMINCIQRYITENRIFGRPDESGKVPVQKSLGARVRLVGMKDWFTFEEELPSQDYITEKQ